MFYQTWTELAHAAGTVFHLDMTEFSKLEPFFNALDPEFFRNCAANMMSGFPEAELEKRFPVNEQAAFRLLCAVANHPEQERIYAENHWPEEMKRQIQGDLKIWLDTLYRDFSGYGLSARILCWCRDCYNGNVKQCGRLQFESLSTFQPPFSLYRNPDGSLRKLLAGKPGNPPRPDLSWKDKTVNLHIPAAGPLTREKCIDSLRQIVSFMETFHPDFEYRAVVCCSWILDDVFRTLMRPGSNIVQFMDLGHSLPWSELDQTKEVRWRIWGEAGRTAPVETLPVRTSMERSVAAYLKQGGKFKEGILILFRDELDNLLKA